MNEFGDKNGNKNFIFININQFGDTKLYVMINITM